MRKLFVLTFVTMDGVMQSPGAPEEDTEGKFTQGGWTPGYWDDFIDRVMNEQTSNPYDLLLGRKTYELMGAYWQTSTVDGAEQLNRGHKYVVSTTLKKLDWQPATLIKSNVVKEIKKLKETDGPELQVHGSSNLIQTLLKNDLVDELRLKIFPVTIGSGKRLFGDGTIPASFKLTDSQVSPQGVLIATYAPDGNIRIGSFLG
jgi:dihydrofolate reductase